MEEDWPQYPYKTAGDMSPQAAVRGLVQENENGDAVALTTDGVLVAQVMLAQESIIAMRDLARELRELADETQTMVTLVLNAAAMDKAEPEDSIGAAARKDRIKEAESRMRRRRFHVKLAMEMLLAGGVDWGVHQVAQSVLSPEESANKR